MASIAWLAACWVGFAALYLIFAGQLAIDECVTAILLASLATAAAARQGRQADRRFWPATPHLAAWFRAAVALGPASVRVATVLVRIARRGGSPGRADRVAFERGPERDPAAAGRRATAVLAASLSPDSFVLRAEPGRDEVLIHAILPDPGPKDRFWLA